jgi:hypothetical protein
MWEPLINGFWKKIPIFVIFKVHSQLGYQKGMCEFLRITKDNFGFLFILHYYSCNGVLYVNK